MDLILDWLILTNLKQVQGFLKATEYYQQFIQDYAEIARLLTKLTKKEGSFKWEKNSNKYLSN